MSRKLIRIHGSGGGKGGSGNTYEADDNLFSRQSAAFIDALAEGPIKGLVYGDASILIDEVRLRNINLKTGVVDAKTNFNNFVMTTSLGSATPTVDPEFFSDYPTAATTQEVGSAELLRNEPQFFTLSSGTFEKTNADYLKITISTSGMSKITKTGKKKGDINTTFNNFNIDFIYTDENGVTHTVNKFRTGFNGKVKSKYAHTFGFNIENHKPFVDWAIKVTRTDSNNSTDDFEVSNAIFCDSIEVAIADKLEYPYTAYVAGVLDAEQFSSIPARGYEIDGKLIQIPSNHFPCDYNGRKVTVNNTTGLSVGDSVKQQISISSIVATGTDEEGYIGTATLSAAHGMANGKTFTVTISGATEDADFYNGTFVAEATTSTRFKYNLNRPESNGTFTALSDTNPAGTKKATIFTGGLIDKISGTKVYLRDVTASLSVLKGSMTFTGVSDNQTRTKTISAVEKVFIPANYRRNSSGNLTTSDQDWNGSFYQSWCNNPAWVFNDLVTNKIYGLGNYLNQDQINKWELYQIGRYCDELVPAGIPASDFATLFTTNDTNYTPGSSSLEHEPRFSANLVINGKEEAYKVLNDVVSIFRGMIYWLNGEALVVQDSEKDPVYQFTNGNVIDGEFTYEGTANKTRTNSVTVTFNNPQDYYRKRVEHVELEETLQKDNEFIKPQAITAFGCTSRGQARRLGKWTLLTNNLHTNTITFQTSLNAAFLRPGDIIQVIDQLKSGKSWGGRISTSSTTTAIKIDRKPTGFGDTSVETGYVAGDYRLSATFVKYAALLAQDTATIGGTSYVRGQEIPNITSEEAAVNVQDTNGDLVFIQWTPYTVVETQTLSSVSNSGKTLTVASAFSSAPSQDTIWTLSRAALQTGKTKEESKLFRVMSIAETEMNTFEITGLEYNASKFDAVDKNEELTEYRTINLPDSFEEVPQIDEGSIEIFPTVEPIAGEGNYQNVLNITWDPVLKADGTPYAFLRGFNVEYSRDGTKWFGAGTTNSTSIEIDGAVSDNYYARVYTVSLQGKKSPPATSGQVEVNFNNVLFVEGTVGNGDYVIPMTGIINSEFNINSSGSVAFTPNNFSYNNSADGDNVSVSSQSALDFSSLADGDVAYVYFDYSAAAFKAIRHDATSDQFYEVGSDIYEDATGTITTTGNTKIFDGTGTDFDGELGLNNTFKVTKNSTNYYPRVTEISSDTLLKVRRNFSQVIASSAFQKPTFFAEYNGTGDDAGEYRDTIMGKVTKTGSEYTLITFGVSRGEQGYSVFGTNESHTFAAGSNGEIAESDYTAYTNDYTVSKGTTSYTFASSGTAANTFGITINSVTGFSAVSDINVDSSTGQITIDDDSMDSIISATVNLTITDLSTGEDIVTRIISFAKASDGAAGVGSNAKVVNLTASTYAVAYDGEGANPSPTGNITLTADAQNFTDARYKFTIDGTAGTIGTSSTGTFAIPSSSFSTPKQMKVEVYEDADTSTILASDTLTIFAVESGGDAITIIMPNDNHTLPRAADGTATLTGSGTEVRVRKGATLLTATNNTPTAGQFKVTRSASTGITVPTGAPTLSDSDSDSVNDTATFADISSVTSGFVRGEIEYSIEVGYTGANVTYAKSQSITVAKSGSDGATVNFAFVRLPAGTSDSDVTATTDGTENTPADFTISSTTYSWSDNVPTGTDTLFAVEGKKAGNATGFTWGTPYRLEGTMAKELIIYSDVTTGNAPADPTATYNFTTGVLSLTGGNASSWNLTPPSFGATPADGAKIHAVTCVVTGSINDTSVSVAAADWSAAFIHAIHEKGDQGDPGVRGVKIKELILYYPHTFSNGSFAAVNAPSTGTYNFSNDTISTIPSGWQVAKPAASTGVIILSSEALATETASLNNVSGSLSWSTPGIADSAFGDTEFIFIRSASKPTTPSASSWPVSGDTPSGWYDDVADVPSGSNPIWSSKGKATMSGLGFPISFNFVWQEPVLIEGSDGEDATNTATVVLYKRSTNGSTAPDVPDNNITYTFATGALSGSLDGWSTSVPSGIAQYVWSCTALALGPQAATTDTIVPADWSTPIVLSEAQQPRRETKAVYYDGWTVGSTKPTINVSSVTYNFSTKALGSLPTGWSTTIPTDGEFAWVILTIQEATFGGTKTITAGEVNTVFIPGVFSTIGSADFDLRVDGTDFQFSLDGGTAYNTASAVPTSLRNSNISINSDGTLSNAGSGQVTTSGIGAETPTGAQTRVNNRLSATEKTRLNSGKSPDDTKDFDNAGTFTGNLSGTISGVAAATVKDNAAEGKQVSDQTSLVPRGDDSEWTIGEVTGYRGVWERNGTGGDENRIVLESGPHGDLTKVWKSISTDGSGADGGFQNTESSRRFTIEDDVVYRFTCFVKQSQSDGTMYVGGYNYNSSGSNINLLNYDGTNGSTNRYFWSGDLPSFGDWYLFVGYFNPDDTNSNSGKGGIYKVATGAKVTSFNDFRFNTSAVSFGVRTYLYYSSSNSGTIARWAHPRIDRLDRAAPSVQQIIAEEDNSLNTKISISQGSNGVLTLNRGGPDADSTTITKALLNLNYTDGADITGNNTANNVSNVGNQSVANAQDGIARARSGLASNGDVNRAVPTAKGGTGQTNTNTFLNSGISISQGNNGVLTLNSGGYAADSTTITKALLDLNYTDGADVTGNNTAADVTNVNGTAASTVKDGAVRANAGLTSTGVVKKVVPKTYGGFGQNVSSVTGVPTLSSGAFSFNTTLPASFGGTGLTSILTLQNSGITIDADGILQGIGTAAKTVDNSVTGNSRTLSITSGSAAFINLQKPTAGGSAANITPYYLFTGTDSQPSYGTLTYTGNSKEKRPTPFFIEAVSTNGYNQITLQNFQFTLSGFRRFYNPKNTVTTEGTVMMWVGAGISSSSTSYNEVTNGFIGYSEVFSDTGFPSNTTNTTNSVKLANEILIQVPDTAQNIGGTNRFLWLWLELYMAQVVQNDANIAAGLADRTDSKIILGRTSGGSQTGTYSHSNSLAQINT